MQSRTVVHQNQVEDQAAAHCKITLDHPWRPGRGNPERERGRRVELRKGEEKTEEMRQEGERRGTGGGGGRVALSYRAGNHKRYSFRRIKLWPVHATLLVTFV